MLKLKRILTAFLLSACILGSSGMFVKNVYAENEIESESETEDDSGLAFKIEDNEDSNLSLEQGTIVNQGDVNGAGFDFDIEVGGSADNPQENMRVVLNGLFVVLTGAASVLMVFGLGKLFLSFKDERPEEKVTAGMYILGSILVFSIRGIVDNVLKESGV